MSKKQPPRDQHRSNRLIRLTEERYQAVKALAARSNRPMTREIDAAVAYWLDLDWLERNKDRK